MNEIVPIDAFLEKLFILPNGDLIELHPHQREILRAAFTPDDNGKLKYRQIVYSCPKKSGKSQIGACVASWFAFSGIGERNGEIYCCANDIEQAQGRVYRALKRSVEMSDVLRHECTKITDKNGIELSNGTMIAALSGDYAGAAGANPEMSLFDELWGYTCFGNLSSSNIKVLTKGGFKKWSDITRSDQIATRNEDGYIEYQNPVRIIYENYDGPLLHFNHRRAHFSVTPNHRVLAAYARSGEDRKEKLNDPTGLHYEYRAAAEAMRAKFGWLPTDAKWEGEHHDSIEIEGASYNARDFFELMGWFLSEGNVTYRLWGIKKHYSGVCIAQCPTANPEKCRQIEALIRRLGFKPKRNGYGIHLHNAAIGRFFAELGKSTTKYIPKWVLQASRPLLERLLEGYLLGDGWKTASHGWQAYTISPQLAEDIMEVALKCGWSVRHMGVRQRSKPQNPIHRISLNKGPIAWEGRMNHWSVTEENTEVWCLEMPNGNFFVNIDGNCFWTGNSESSKRLYEEMTPVPTRRNSIRVITTYAGFEAESELLETIYKEVVRPENMIDLGSYMNYVTGEVTRLPVYVKGDSFVYWDHECRMPWQTKDFMEDARNQPGFRLSAYLRLYENRWVGAEEGLDMDDWDKCVEISKTRGYDSCVPPDTSMPIAAAVDASTVKDRTAVSTVFKQDGRLWLGPRKTWQPTKENPLIFEETIEKYILELYSKYFLTVVFYDPWQMESSAQKLRSRGVNMIQYPQTQPNTIVMTEFFIDKLRNGHFMMYPDTELRAEASSISVKEVPGRGRRFIKTTAGKKIDSLIATSMAALAAEYHCPDMQSMRDQIFSIRLNKKKRG